EKSAKELDQLLASQITDKCKKGFGYNAVPSPHPLILNRPTLLDLSYSGLEEFKEPEENTDDSLKQQQKIDSKTSSVKSPLKVDKDWKEKFFCPANHVREEEPKKARENNDAPIIKDWVSDDEDKVEPIPKVEKKTVIPTATKKEFIKPKKPVRRSVSFDHIQYNCPKTSHPSAHKHMAPRAALMKIGLKSVNTARLVNTVRSVNTGRPFSTARFNNVKASACWVWKTKNRVIDHVSKNNIASVTLKRLDYIDAQGRFKSVMAWGRHEHEPKFDYDFNTANVPVTTVGAEKDQEDEVFGSIKHPLSKDKEENSWYCSRLQLPVLNQSVNTAKITAVGEKVNAAESLLVVSTEVNAN
ncbi:hypothetical protein Tco_1305322, partial [Tanacetum coccineum]